ncbi:antitoxin family protein [Acidobacteria bacterium AH-259-G07]|nr:antitoxin family protein [Acidobacteria bacterium AH-259-G07]
MVIKAKYEDGVFKPLEDVSAREGTVVEVYLPRETKEEKRRPSLKDSPLFGMWADRTDFKDGLDYVNRIRKYRRK